MTAAVELAHAADHDRVLVGGGMALLVGLRSADVRRPRGDDLLRRRGVVGGIGGAQGRVRAVVGRDEGHPTGFGASLGRSSGGRRRTRGNGGLDGNGRVNLGRGGLLVVVVLDARGRRFVGGFVASSALVCSFGTLVSSLGTLVCSLGP